MQGMHDHHAQRALKPCVLRRRPESGVPGEADRPEAWSLAPAEEPQSCAHICSLHQHTGASSAEPNRPLIPVRRRPEDGVPGEADRGEERAAEPAREPQVAEALLRAGGAQGDAVLLQERGRPPTLQGPHQHARGQGGPRTAAECAADSPSGTTSVDRNTWAMGAHWCLVLAAQQAGTSGSKVQLLCFCGACLAAAVTLTAANALEQLTPASCCRVSL